MTTIPSQPSQKRSKALATILYEAIPLIQKYAGEYVVYKIGGHVLDDEKHLDNFAKDIVSMNRAKIKTVIVHGGSTDIKKFLKKMCLESRFKNGLRITDAPTMKVVEMVLSGLLNKSIVNAIQESGGKAIGISGKDGGLLKVTPTKDQDLGFVAEPMEEQHHLKTLLGRLTQKDLEGHRYVPVISPISAFEGKTYNVNADSAASVIARCLNAKRLFFLTDVDGIIDKNGQRISQVTLEKAQDLLKDREIIKGGMHVKLKSAIDAVKGGVGAVVFLNGRLANVSLLEAFTKDGIGTLITQ